MQPIIARLQELEKGVRNKVLRKALREPVRLLLQQARAHAPKHTRALTQSLASKITVRGDRAVGTVGPRNQWSVVKRGKTKIPNLYARRSYPQLKQLSRTAAEAALQASLRQELEALARGS